MPDAKPPLLHMRSVSCTHCGGAILLPNSVYPETWQAGQRPVKVVWWERMA